MKKTHTFHIPVMGTGFSIDTPIKVAQYGISSVISLVDDTLMEDMRQYYCKLFNTEYVPITKYEDDFRARRITAYLNLVDQIVQKKFETVKSSCFELGSEITKYFEMLSDQSPLKALYKKMLAAQTPELKEQLQKQLRAEMKPGSIDVNIMTKLDRTNYTLDKEKKELPPEYSDALAALRGYAHSTLESAIVLSAGINRHLYSYFEKFEDFYADAKGYIRKKIILKVSDYRSSLIQGRFLAKKGLWVSEYRVESGLNCGGHAFASDGYLMGPILEEFKVRRKELCDQLHHIYNKALELKKNIQFKNPLSMAITAQGGIGTVTENQFLLNHYELDGTGWATPFLLVPEATNVDATTLQKLSKATENDLYLSGVSPLGVPFNNLKDSESDLQKQKHVDAGRPGSACPKGYLVSNTEFTEKPICTASRQYQNLKIEQLEKLKLSAAAFKEKFNAIVQKACICNDLAESPLINHKIEKRGGMRVTAICPGPNLAYFSKIVSLKEMIDHIYGQANLITHSNRPHMFIKELKMYVEYFKKEIENRSIEPTERDVSYLRLFRDNLIDGIDYYIRLFEKIFKETKQCQDQVFHDLSEYRTKIEHLITTHPRFFFKNSPQLIPISA